MSEPDQRQTRWTADSPSTQWAAVVVLGAVLSTWMVLTQQLKFVQSDGLMRVFASLYHWTPYTWGESRFGMLVPLLASPISSPIANLLVQQLANTFFVLLFPFLLCRFLLGARGWLLAGSLTVALFILTFQQGGMSFLANELPYSTAGVAALLAYFSWRKGRPWSVPAACLLWAIACWMSPSMLIWGVPLLVLRLSLTPDEATSKEQAGAPIERLSVLLIAVAIMTGIAVSVALTGRLVPIDDPTPIGLSPVADWRETWVLLGHNMLAVTPGWLFPALLGFAVAIRVLGANSKTRWRELLFGTGALLAVILLTAATEFLATGTLQWVAFNERTTTMGWRYLTVGIHLLLAGVALVVARLTFALAGRRSSRLIELLAVPALILLVAAKYGPLELDRGRKALSYCTHQALFLDPPAHAIADSGAAFVIGEYWKVYPLVFRVNSILHQRGEKRTVWPLADRAESARSVWEPHDWQEVTIAALAGDPFVGWSREHFELPELVRIESRDGLDFYRVAGAVAAPAP